MGKCAYWRRATNNAKKSKFEVFESALYMKSWSMPLKFVNIIQEHDIHLYF